MPPPPGIFGNLYCKWCILNQFSPSTKELKFYQFLAIFFTALLQLTLVIENVLDCLCIYGHRDKGGPIEKGGSAPRLDPPLVDLPKQVLVLLRLYIVVMHFIQIPTFHNIVNCFHVYFHEISTLHVCGHTPSPNL